MPSIDAVKYFPAGGIEPGTRERPFVLRTAVTVPRAVSQTRPRPSAHAVTRSPPAECTVRLPAPGCSSGLPMAAKVSRSQT